MGLFEIFFKKRVTEEEQIPQEPVKLPEITGEFRFIVEDVFTITGRGTVVTGKIESGTLHLNDVVVLNNTRPLVVKGIEAFRKLLDSAQAGDNVGILLSDIKMNDIKRGDILVK